MITEGKGTDIFSMADDFRKIFDDRTGKQTIKNMAQLEQSRNFGIFYFIHAEHFEKNSGIF